MIPQCEQAVKGVHKLKPYIPGKPLELIEREYQLENVIKVASNENPYGPSPQVIAALSEFVNKPLNISMYPDGSAWLLKQKLAKMHQTDAEQLTMGNGSNDVLDLITRIFAGPSDEIIFSQYAFAVYPICTQAVGATAIVTEALNWGNNLEAMLASITDKTKLIFIANPNNPTGTCLPSNDLYQFMQQVPEQIMVVIDEAYAEYTKHELSPWSDTYSSAIAWLTEFDNLIITRTFSKAYGLAGLRIGYALSHIDIANFLNRIRQPFNNNSLSLIAALAALEDQDYTQNCIQKNWLGMRQLIQGFHNLDLETIPSAANFICVKLNQDSLTFEQKLLHKGIIARPIANYGMPDFLRISIGKSDENQMIIDTFKSIL